MKKAIKIISICIAIGMILVSLLGLYIVIDRQKRFEEFASAHIQLLMEELSVTNINASKLKLDVEKLLKTQTEESTAVDRGSFRPPNCGEKKREGDKK
jgi:hypothetical protein